MPLEASGSGSGAFLIYLWKVLKGLVAFADSHIYDIPLRRKVCRGRAESFAEKIEEMLRWLVGSCGDSSREKRIKRSS